MTTKQIIDLFKRFLIVFLICIPLIVVLTVKTNLGGGVIPISALICGALFVLEEYIHYKVIKKRKERREKLKKDKK